MLARPCRVVLKLPRARVVGKWRESGEDDDVEPRYGRSMKISSCHGTVVLAFPSAQGATKFDFFVCGSFSLFPLTAHCSAYSEASN